MYTWIPVSLFTLLYTWPPEKKLLTVTNTYEDMGNISYKRSDTHSSYGTIIQSRNLKLESRKIVEFIEKMDELYVSIRRLSKPLVSFHA